MCVGDLNFGPHVCSLNTLIIKKSRFPSSFYYCTSSVTQCGSSDKMGILSVTCHLLLEMRHLLYYQLNEFSVSLYIKLMHQITVSDISI